MKSVKYLIRDHAWNHASFQIINCVINHVYIDVRKQTNNRMIDSVVYHVVFRMLKTKGY